MFKAEQIAVQYVASSTIEKQGNHQSIDRYLRQGYYVKVSRNGYWVLTKPAKVLVTAYCGLNGTYTHNMKSEIVSKYNRSKISVGLIETFKNDFKNGSLSVMADETNFDII